MEETDPTVARLLRSTDPSVRYFAVVELTGASPEAQDARAARALIISSPRVRSLLAGQRSDGGFGVPPYKKWQGAHWRLVSLGELGVPAGEPRAVAAARNVLSWLTGDRHKGRIRLIEGRVRECASKEGNALAACVRAGLAAELRVEQLARSLVAWQWPDGGWNCDVRPEARHSSFHESLAPILGLAEYARATGDGPSLAAARRGAELFLRHRLFRSESTGETVSPAWIRLRYPPYWHYDVLQGLRVVGMVASLEDPRAADALDVVESRRRPDGTWSADGTWWRPPRSSGSNVEVVDWGRKGPNEFVTLNALRVLRAAGRLRPNGPEGTSN